MGGKPDFSSPSDQGLTSSTTDHPGKPVEDNDSRAALGAVAQRQKAAEITMENKKTAQTEDGREGRKSDHSIGGFRRELNPSLADFASRSTGGRGETDENPRMTLIARMSDEDGPCSKE